VNAVARHMASRCVLIGPITSPKTQSGKPADWLGLAPFDTSRSTFLVAPPEGEGF
jgi:hypothetical protein